MRSVAVVLLALSLATPALAQTSAPRQPTISVMGTGEAELKPDFARIHVTVATQADTVAQASTANNTATERVLARIQGLGIKREDIRTANFQVFQTPQQVGPDGKEMKTPKFSAHHRLQITTRDLDGVGRLAGEILASGDMTFQSVSFGLDRQEQGADKAREAAVRDAKRQADVYAAAAGVSLGRLLEIRDGSAQPFEPQPDMRMSMAMAKGAESVPIVPPATIRYTANVQLVWEMAGQP
ncbi:SIMPL domain-containing protein [Microvirga terrestris]|uniref:SIMPL domain-containing protein n=1 Tax=Microvirga terrestris TaxID=2791024 RepID=A0ABS0HSZ4_9HYPH|nr:SIMPL domain-containing protein [Microvirga terrestris]MBF9196509.1 SIMPL domain-containing protein [Microvirga terrestris]